jgi:hypothetical protein
MCVWLGLMWSVLPRLRSWRPSHRGLQHPHGPRDASYLGGSLDPEEDSGGLEGGEHHPIVLVRGACLRCWSLGLDADRMLFPWAQAILLVVFLFFSFFCIDIYIHTLET